MCCCAKANVNGEPGYSWTPDGMPGVYPQAPPPLDPNDPVVYDLPGRCAKTSGSTTGVDSHCHHFHITRRGRLAYRHGGGHGSFRIACGPQVLAALARLDSDGQYFLARALYQASADAAHDAREMERRHWYAAAADKRIKVTRRGGVVLRVAVLPAIEVGAKL